MWMYVKVVLTGKRFTFVLTRKLNRTSRPVTCLFDFVVSNFVANFRLNIIKL